MVGIDGGNLWGNGERVALLSRLLQEYGFGGWDEPLEVGGCPQRVCGILGGWGEASQ